MNIPTATGIFRRYLLWLKYDGSKYNEMATSRNGYGIMDTLYRAIEHVLQAPSGKTLQLSPSSRTDSGVHAIRTSAILHAPIGDSGGLDDSDASKATFLTEINDLLQKVEPAGLKLLDFHSVNPGFCQRKHVVYRQYVYRLLVKQNYMGKPTLAMMSERKYAWIVTTPSFDANKAAEACSLLQGSHNFASFFKHRSRERIMDPYPYTSRSMQCIQLYRGEGFVIPSDEFEYYNVMFISKAFLREQIRRIMAVIVSYACGRIQKQDIAWLLSRADPQSFFAFAPMKAAPPNGLFLADVVYDPRMFSHPDPVVVHPWDTENARFIGEDDA